MDEPVRDGQDDFGGAPTPFAAAGGFESWQLSTSDVERGLSEPPSNLEEQPLLSPTDLVNPRKRRVLVPLALFVAACYTTFQAGASNWYFDLSWNPRQGLIYSAAVIGILLFHEMGHFLQTVRYAVPASLPWFIPIPGIPTGTMGAVISMDGSRANRRQLFDIGVSGPLAGLLVAIPVAWFGVKFAHVQLPTANPADYLPDPLIFKLFAAWSRPDLPAGFVLEKQHNPLLMAGWFGMLLTGLNMLPVSQLDGGHVIYGLFGERSRWIGRAFVVAAVIFIVVSRQKVWVPMLVLILLLGVDHPPTRDDSAQLTWGRRIVGVAALVIPILCFAPMMLRIPF